MATGVTLGGTTRRPGESFVLADWFASRKGHPYSINLNRGSGRNRARKLK
jgi:hypothetical protein